MNTIDFANINDTFMSSTQIIWGSILRFLPILIVAIVIVVLGFALAVLLGKLVTKIMSKMQVDKLLNIVGLDEKLKKVDVQFTISGLFGWIVKWFIIIAVLLTVSSILGLEEVSQFLMQVLLYVPKVLVAVVILTIGLVVGNFMSELVEKSVEISDFVNEASVSVLSAATKWIIVIFALMAALSQLGIAQDLIQILFTGIVAMFAIAGGLAFGLGGKDKAQVVIATLFDKK